MGGISKPHFFSDSVVKGAKLSKKYNLIQRLSTTQFKI